MTQDDPALDNGATPQGSGNPNPPNGAAGSALDNGATPQGSGTPNPPDGTAGSALSNGKPAKGSDDSNPPDGTDGSASGRSPVLNLAFQDPTGEAIPGLSFRVATSTGNQDGVTDGDGKGQVKINGSTPFEVQVLRDQGTQKTIFKGTMPNADANIHAISPCVKIPAKTEPHQGGGSSGSSASGSASGGASTKPKVTNTRNTEGHPVAVVKGFPNDRKMSDIIENGIDLELSTNPVTLGFYWGYRLLQWAKSGPKAEIKVPAPTEDDGKNIPVEMTEAGQKQLETLMDFAMKQVKWKYTKDGTTGAIDNLMDKKWKPEDNSKDAGASLGKCYTYVKVALNMAKITTITSTPNSAAKLAVQEFLIPEHFKSITEECQHDPYLAFPGDVIVYKKYAYTHKEEALIKSINENVKKGKASGKKPDSPENQPGHIEFRTVDGFISDFFSRNAIAAHSYKVVGIYRKIHDEMAEKRQKAFLKMLRLLETGDNWFALNSRIDGKNTFSDTSRHPWAQRGKPGLGSTAAGAYQITIDKYNDYQEIDFYSNGPSFDPKAQEHMAIRILEAQGKTKASALSLIRQGKIRESITDTGLFAIWSCLPGGVSPQVKSMDEFISRWRELL